MVEQQRTKKRINWGLWLKLAVAGGILTVVAYKTDWSGFAREIAQAEPVFIAAGGLLMGVTLLGGTARWRLLLAVQGVRVSYLRMLRINSIGYFFNQFIMGSTGGDLVKIFYIMQDAPTKKARAALSIVMDRVMGLIAMLSVTFALLPWQWGPLSSNPGTRPIITGLALVLTTVFVGIGVTAVFPFKRLPSFFHRLWEKFPKRDVIESLYEGFHAHGKQARLTGLAFLTAMLNVIPLLGMGTVLARALHLDIDLGAMTVLFAIVLCAMSVPVLPGGHGMREGAFALLFSVFGVSRGGVPVGIETALASSTLLLGVTLLWAFVGGCVFLFSSRKPEKAPSE